MPIHFPAVFGSSLCRVYTLRQVALTGSALATVSFALASFSTTLWHLYATFAVAGKYKCTTFCCQYESECFHLSNRLNNQCGINIIPAGFSCYICNIAMLCPVPPNFYRPTDPLLCDSESDGLEPVWRYCPRRVIDGTVGLFLFSDSWIYNIRPEITCPGQGLDDSIQAKRRCIIPWMELYGRAQRYYYLFIYFFFNVGQTISGSTVLPCSPGNKIHTFKTIIDINYGIYKENDNNQEYYTNCTENGSKRYIQIKQYYYTRF